MIIKVNDKTMQLVQLSSNDSDIPKGLYLIPYSVTMDEFEAQVKAFDKSENGQDDFDELNTIGAHRVYAYDCMLELANY